MTEYQGGTRTGVDKSCSARSTRVMVQCFVGLKQILAGDRKFQLLDFLVSFGYQPVEEIGIIDHV